jgi:hypothetical protein
MKGDLEPNWPIEVFFIKKADIERDLKEILNTRWGNLQKKPWIEGIQSLHQFSPRGIRNISCRATSMSTDFETFMSDSY